MYSTKVLHKNLHKMGFTTIGDPFDKPRSKKDRNSRIHGVQFRTDVLKKGNLPSGTNRVLFQKDVKFGPFGKLAEAIVYRNKSRKHGFGTSDAPRRDEFTSNIGTERYRGLLNTEKMMQRRQAIGAKEVGKVKYTDRIGEHIRALEEKEKELSQKLGLTERVETENAGTDSNKTIFQYE